VVLKPSEIAPISAIVFSEIMHAAGTPAGVYNMVNGDGPSVGQVMAGHKDVDMVSFTGSTRAGILVAKTAADTVKRVAQELGGKSPNIILEDADLESAVRKGVEGCMSNTGQSCDAPTRMLVPRTRHDEALAIAKRAAESQKVGDPQAPDTVLGPVVSELQFNKIQGLIKIGIDEGATLVSGGLGRPEGLSRGYYVRPTVFGGVTPEMTVAREEIFGPVLVIMPYDSEEQAITIANDTVYGLAAYVQSGNLEHARKVARQLRAGQVNINYPEWDTFAPFGGYKQSGNGREYADWGIHDFLEIKGIIGYGAPSARCAARLKRIRPAAEGCATRCALRRRRCLQSGPAARRPAPCGAAGRRACGPPGWCRWTGPRYGTVLRKPPGRSHASGPYRWGPWRPAPRR
jgi:aldehyde dehydrogenase (NAD+)